MSWDCQSAEYTMKLNNSDLSGYGADELLKVNEIL